MYLEKLDGVETLKKLNIKELIVLASEIRQYLIDTLKTTGGHLASNLGAVEISIALHYVFDSPSDKIIWDVGHQSYVHKILTGRKEELKGIRQFDGISGFPKREESPHDIFDTGHASTSISAALGIARARDVAGEKYSVIPVIGDGALTGGMTFEALNDIANTKNKLLIIFNDNEMSISKNVGGLSMSMTKFRLSGGYQRFKRGVKGTFGWLPPVYNFFRFLKNRIKSVFVRDKYFKNFGLNYIGPVDGHDLKTLINILKRLKKQDKSVVFHIKTKKGKGYQDAEEMPENFHGVSADFDTNKSEKDENATPLPEEKSFSRVFGDTLCDLAEQDNRVVAITAAMPDGTGLNPFKERFPSRFFDTGITEEHAVTMAAGMAVGGLKPYVAIYSTFLQRAFDQVMLDVCLQKLPVVFCLDRGGLSGADGETHQGVFDIGYLSMIPNLSLFAPKDALEMQNFLRWSLNHEKPLAIRYPKSHIKDFENHTEITLGKWEYISQHPDARVTILASGDRMLDLAERAASQSQNSCNIVSARWLKPLDREMLKDIIDRQNTIITLEDNALAGGFNTYVSAFNNLQENPTKVVSFGVPDEFIKQGTVSQLLTQIEITPKNIATEIDKNLPPHLRK